jgi:type II secretory pathway component GspD/PulD (secretin)
VDVRRPRRRPGDGDERGPNQVEIDVTFVAFDLKLIEEIARKSDRAAPTGEEIKALWREGKGRIAGTSKVVTRSGVNAQTKGVDEVIYPTEFQGTTGSNGVADALNAVPASFETREIGFIHNVTPTVGPDGYTIDLTLVPELCELLDWDDVGVGFTGADGKEVQAHMRQPRFHSRNLTTSIVLWDGETVVAGSMPNSGGTEMTYAFISARLLDPSGQPLKKQAAGGYVELPPDAKPATTPKK